MLQAGFCAQPQLATDGCVLCLCLAPKMQPATRNLQWFSTSVTLSPQADRSCFVCPAIRLKIF